MSELVEAGFREEGFRVFKPKLFRSHNLILKKANPFDFHFHDISHVHITGAFRCSRPDDVPRPQGHKRRYIADKLFDAKDHKTRMAILFLLSVHPALNREIMGIEAGYQARA
jgi:hypothetical protein